MELHDSRGYLDDDALRAFAGRRRVPLFRLEGLVSFYPHFRRTPPPRVTVRVCRDVTCVLAGGDQQCQRLQDEFDDDQDVEVVPVSCLGRCDAAPALAINDLPLAPTTLLDHARVCELIDAPNRIPAHLPTTTVARYACDPYATSDEHYATVLARAKDPDRLAADCINILKASGLRGMGGAGFPTGLKWEMVAGESSSPKYVICNADESEPGTFKDRAILDELPHLVVEGMLLAALTVGATQGIVYLRHEYAREHRALEAAIVAARRRGVLGNQAAGSGSPFDIDVFISPGGYILGEETALLEALEDKRGEPRNKPPYPGRHGLWGEPTLINNVESFALATSIIHHGADWWNQQGADGFTGLKFVSVSGDVAVPGVYEIPVGTTVRDLIRLAGGMRDGRKLKAFLPGGASSNFLTAEQVDTPLDFDAIRDVGSMLGTGAVIAIGQQHDLFRLATNIVRFFRNESCGKCVPCRIGSEKAVQILEAVSAGANSPDELSLLHELGETLEQTSICGLGQVALNPILSMMKHFPEEIPS